MNVSRAALAGGCAVLVLSCGDGGCGADNHAPAEGILLAGKPEDNALAAVTDLQAIPADDAALLNGMLLTRLDAAIRPEATIGEVNAALRAVGGGIAAMRAGLPVMVVAVPQQPDAAGLEALAAGCADKPTVIVAGTLERRPRQPDVGARPGGIPAGHLRGAGGEPECERERELRPPCPVRPVSPDGSRYQRDLSVRTR